MSIKNMKKILRYICVSILVLMCVVSTISMLLNNVKAYSNTNNKIASKRPTYTVTLSENNKLLKKLEDKLSKKPENKSIRFIKENGADIVDGTVSIIKTLKASLEGEDIDVEQYMSDCLKSIIIFIAEIHGFGDLTSSIFNGLDELLITSATPLSDFEIFEDNINQQFSKMSDQLYDIQDQISELSVQVNNSIEYILNNTSTQIENMEAKQILRRFFSSVEGNFSYLNYKSYMYNSTCDQRFNGLESYYIRLIETIIDNKDEKTVKYYYDKLFNALYSNINMLEEYFYGTVVGLDKSIVKYYYDYIIANPSLVPNEMTAEYAALEFALDLYTTYLYSYELIQMCHSYQLTQMYLEEQDVGKELNSYSKYEYRENEYIYYSTILKESAAISEKYEYAEEMIANDIAYIFNMSNSYIAVDDDNTVHDISNNSVSFGNIYNKQIIYLNTFTNQINQLFNLDSNKFAFYANETMVNNETNNGVFNFDKYGDVTEISLKYGNTQLYAIKFYKNNNSVFNGGDGSYEQPYLISDKNQVLYIKNDLTAHYKLIDNISMDNVSISPIGTIETPFTGVFDGNGYTISNFSIVSIKYDEKNKTLAPTTGLFGTIGEKGTIQNLNLTNISVKSIVTNDGLYPQMSNNIYYVGGIAGYNKGIIKNCTIQNSTIVVNRLKDCKESRNIEMLIGGIAGDNRGTISYCSLSDSTIDVSLGMKLYSEPTAKNKVNVYVAGITSTTTTPIEYCRVNRTVELSVEVESVANNKSRVSPYITVLTGGIIANNEDAYLLSKVYSDIALKKCIVKVQNDGGNRTVAYKNIYIQNGKYYPIAPYPTGEVGLSEIEKYFYKDIYDNVLKQKIRDYNKSHPLCLYNQAAQGDVERVNLEASIDAKKDVITEIESNEKTILKNINAMSEYDNYEFVYKIKHYDISIIDDTIYEINSTTLNYDNIRILIDNMDVDAEIISYYGFNTYNTTFNQVERIVKVFFTAIINGEKKLLSGDVKVKIKEDRLLASPYIYGIKLQFAINEDVNSLYLNNGFKIIYPYASGNKEYLINKNNKSQVIVIGFDTTKIGSKGFDYNIIHNNNKIDVHATVKCYHKKVTANAIDEVVATCKSLGYEVYKCLDCGSEIHLNYCYGNHIYIAENGEQPTCGKIGYTDSIKCKSCGEYAETRKVLQKLSHQYITVSIANDRGYNVNMSYNDKYHYCIQGDHYEPHQYIVNEQIDDSGNLVYTYVCNVCDYKKIETDYNIVTDEKSQLPSVYITDGYALYIGDIVSVYVQIVNNPGICGANFGIRYTTGLELIDYEENDKLLAQSLKASNPVYNGYNFFWLSDKKGNVEDGYLIKLKFKITELENINDIRTVSVVYGMQQDSDGGFIINANTNKIQKFMTHSGTISIVDHLPGDVNNDGIVDIMDVMHIAWYKVGKTDIGGDSIVIDKKYADVNLDGVIDMIDAIAILEYITGQYGRNLLNYKYQLILNFNGLENDNYLSTTIEYYDDLSSINTWNSQLSFEEYEKQMNKKGYTFAGWWTRINGGELISETELVKYDKAQGKQTIYAHWTKNKVLFDLNGGENEFIEDTEYNELYDDAKNTISLREPSQSYIVEFYVDGNLITSDISDSYIAKTIYRSFLYWEDQFKNKYYVNSEIDLSKFNLGNNDYQGIIKLKAVWGNYILTLPEKDGRPGYNKIDIWYTDKYYVNKYDSKELVELVENKFVLYGKSNPIEYSIRYINLSGTTNIINPQKFKVTETAKIKEIVEPVIGKKFIGWSNLDDIRIDQIDEKNFLQCLDADNVNTLVLKAVWELVEYEITFATNGGNKLNKLKYTIETENIDIPTTTKEYNIFDGWYVDAYLNEAFVDDLKTDPRNITLFAKWLPVKRKVYMYSNPITISNMDCSRVCGNWDVEVPRNWVNNYSTNQCYRGNNLEILFNPIKRKYNLNITTNNDPFAVIGQTVRLEKGRTYYVHINIAEKYKGSIQMFYAINGQFTEDQSIRFDKNGICKLRFNNATSVASETGEYIIRFDNDYGKNVTLTDFYIYMSESVTELNLAEGERLSSLLMLPELSDHAFVGYFDNNDIKYYDNFGNLLVNDVPKQDVILYPKFVKIKTLIYQPHVHRINAQAGVYEKYMPNLDIQLLKELGYTRVLIQFTINMHTIDANKEYVWICKSLNQNKDFDLVVHKITKSVSSKNTAFYESFTLSYDKINENGEFYVRFGGKGGHNADWWLENRTMTITAIK